MNAGDLVADRFEIGSIVAGRYVIEKLAGQGGMGSVYRARRRDTDALVALKMIHAPGREMVERFEREADVLARLSHPAIVRHIEHGRTDAGELFLAMEWLEGEDLAARLSRGTLGVETAVGLARQIADALGAVHAQGLVHRDVKPSNVFLAGGSTERAVLIDFGIARHAAAGSSLTRTGSILGTPQYMAPEQVRGGRDVDARADVFSLGCVLFEALAGKPAFAGEHPMAVLAKILLDQPRSLRDVRSDVPEALRGLVDRMLSKVPGERPRDGAELASELGRCARDAATSSSTSDTRSTGRDRATALTARERRLTCVVLASTGLDVSAGATMTPGQIGAEHDAVRRAIEPHGGQLATLGGHDVAITVAARGVASDQAAHAARCALATARVMPGARVSIAMGWAEVDPIPVGEVIDRAAAILARVRSTAPSADRGNDSASVVVDDVSANLLELRFDVARTSDANTLRGERTGIETPRTLLGRPTACVGRDRELGVLAGLLGEVVTEGVARAAVVVAAAGVGKSRLRHEFMSAVRGRDDTVKVLLARGDVLRSGSPLDLAAQLVRQSIGMTEGDASPDARNRLHARVDALVTGRFDVSDATAFIGEIAGVPFPDDFSARLAAGRRDARMMGDQMQRAWLAWLDGEARAQPVALVLEDLHWADAHSVRYLDAALRELADRPLFVLALARPDVYDRFPALWRERGTQELRLAGLTQRACERLVRGVLGDIDPALQERVIRQSDGNALYLEELIRAAAGGRMTEAPTSVVAMVQSRLSDLDPLERRTLRAASIFGESFRADDVAALVGAADGEDVPRVLASLVAREVMARREDADPGSDLSYAFRHALVREAAYEMLTPDDRRLGHRLAAERLEARAFGDALVLAQHYDHAEQPLHAARQWAVAARQAIAKNDFEGASASAECSIARGAEGDVLAEALAARGRARAGLGRWLDAQRDLETALELISPNAQLRRLELLQELWLVGVFRQDSGVLRRSGTEAATIARSIGGRDIEASAKAALAVAHFADGECARSATMYREAVASSGDRPAPVMGLAGVLLYHCGAHAEAEEISTRMVRIADDVGDATTSVILHANIGLMKSAQARYAEADDSFARARALATRYGLQTLLARSVSTSAGYHLDVFDLETAVSIASEARDIGGTLEFVTPRISASLDIATAYARTGDGDRAAAILDPIASTIAAGTGFHGWIWRMRARTIHGEIALARRQWDAALRLADESIEECRRLLRVKYEMIAHGIRARALVGVGRLGDAVDELDTSIRAASATDEPAVWLRLCLARLQLGQDNATRDRAEESAARIERGLPPGQAKEKLRAGVAGAGLRA